jgi:hypothetical protein
MGYTLMEHQRNALRLNDLRPGAAVRNVNFYASPINLIDGCGDGHHAAPAGYHNITEFRKCRGESS